MTPRPNALGYAVLAGFVGLGIYAITGKAKAKSCPITAEGVKLFNETLGVSALWLPQSGPPDAESVANSTRIRFPDVAPDKDFDSPVIVIDESDTFYRYKSSGIGEVTVEVYPRAKADYCRINGGS